MKFHQLPIGARFAFRETLYTKVSPLRARNEADDAEKLIARSAEVTRLAADSVRTAPTLPEALTGTDVESAAWQLVDRCKLAAQAIEPTLQDDQLAQLNAAIDSAAQQFLSRLAEK